MQYAVFANDLCGGISPPVFCFVFREEGTCLEKCGVFPGILLLLAFSGTFGSSLSLRLYPFCFFYGKSFGKGHGRKKEKNIFPILSGNPPASSFFQVQCSSTFPTENGEGLDALWHLLLQLPLYSLPLRLLSGKGGGAGHFFLFPFRLCLSGAFSGTNPSLFRNAGRNQKSCIFL